MPGVLPTPLLTSDVGVAVGFRSSSQYAPGTNGTTAVLPVPTGAAIGDIAVVGIYKENTAAVTPPDGTWTSKASLTTSGASHGSLHVFWKRLTAADTGTYTFTWTGSDFRAAAAGLWSGRIASGDPFDGTVGTSEPGSTSTTVNVSTSPAAANGDAIGFWTNFNGGASFTAPTNYTQRQSVSGVIAMETRDAVASGSTGNVTATASITDWMKAFLGVLAEATAGGITGTVAVTEASDTSSASGQLGYSGTSAATEAADTSSATGTVINPVTGTSAVTQANQTSSASGQLGYSGTSARTQAAQTSSASGQLGYSGTSARTQADQTATASGTFTAGGSFSGTVAVTQASNTASASGTFTPGSITGTAAVTQANQTGSAIGQLGYSGTSARTQANQTSSASGTVVNPITGTASPVQANQTSAAIGKLGYTGTLARTQANQTANATGAVSGPVTGSVAVTQANQTASISGYFTALVAFGTSSAGVGIAPSSHPNQGLAPYSAPGSLAEPSASGATAGVPTSTGG